MHRLMCRRATAGRSARPLVPAALLCLLLAPPAIALEAGDPIPYFHLPWLDGREAPSSPEIFAESEFTALVVWNRACPRCTGLALQCDVLADSLRRAGGVVLGLLFGPDDPTALRDRLSMEDIRTPHLWDESGFIARDLELGDRHLGIFVADKDGRIVAVVGDEIEELTPPVLRAFRETNAPGPRAATATEETEASSPSLGARGGRPAATAPPTSTPRLSPPSTARPSPPSSPRSSPHPAPRFAVDARLRLLSTEGARHGDTGFFGEPLEGGALIVGRWDARLVVTLARGVELVPRLRLSSESDETLAEGAEPWASRYGTLSLGLRRGSVRATAGAFEERIAPLVLQRWDADDAPPIGGVAGCGCAGAGPAGIGQKSLEELGPSYTFEGLSAGLSRPWVRLRASLAVPRRERVSDADDPRLARAESRFRRVLSAAVIEAGRAGSEDPRTGLPAPWGIRLARLVQDDDRRSIDPDRAVLPGLEQDEAAWSAWGGIGPLAGVRIEGEGAWWSSETHAREPLTGQPSSSSREARAFRAGAGFEHAAGALRVSGRLHAIRTEPGFTPYYRALTYAGGREGWRAAAGMELRDASGAREIVAGEFFHRTTRKSEDDPQRRQLPGRGRIREEVSSASLRLGPSPALHLDGTVLRSLVDYPHPLLSDLRKYGVSGGVRWRGWPALEPALRVDWIRFAEGLGSGHAAIVASLWLRARV